MQKALRSTLVAITLILCGTSALAADNAAIIGTWSMALDLQGQQFVLDLVINESADGLSGTIGAPEFGVNPVSKVQFDGDTLKFEADDQQGGVVAIALKLAEDKLSGTLASPMGDIPATATRK
jgi:hypothetical protein